jgi:hypothetical protein
MTIACFSASRAKARTRSPVTGGEAPVRGGEGAFPDPVAVAVDIGAGAVVLPSLPLPLVPADDSMVDNEKVDEDDDVVAVAVSNRRPGPGSAKVACEGGINCSCGCFRRTPSAGLLGKPRPIIGAGGKGFIVDCGDASMLTAD